MKTIVVYNNKGGIGKTTLSVHFALCASQRRIKTLLVGLDRQGRACRCLPARQLDDRASRLPLPTALADRLRIDLRPRASS